MNDLITAAIVVIGVPAVLVGYILLTERLIQALPRTSPGQRPAVVLDRPGAGVPGRLPDLPDAQHDRPVVHGRTVEDSSSGSTTTSGSSGDRGTIEALRNSVLWVVFMTGGVVGLGLLIADPRRPGALRVGRQDR